MDGAHYLEQRDRDIAMIMEALNIYGYNYIGNPISMLL